MFAPPKDMFDTVSADSIPAQMPRVTLTCMNREPTHKLLSIFVKELAAKGMTISTPSESLKKELSAIGDAMTADWVKTAGPEGQAVIDAYRGR